MADPDMVRPMRNPAEGGSAPRRGLVLGAIAFGLGLAFAGPGAPSGERLAGKAGPGEPERTSGTVVLTGVRASRGGAVDCPQLRDDAGVLHPVSYLPSWIALGERVTVRGTFGVTATCRGVVLVVDELVKGAR